MGPGTSSAGFAVPFGHARISSSKTCPASAVARFPRPAASPTAHGVAQTVLGHVAKPLGSMEGATHPRDTQNRYRLASCWIPALLEVAFQSQVEGRTEAGEQRNSSL